MTHLNVPPECWRLIQEQRTSMKSPAEYGPTMQRAFDTFAAHLPANVGRVMDIGCGMAGIQVMFHRAFPDAEIVLVDKQGVSPRIVSGYSKSKDQFSHYHDFSGALDLLESNDVNLLKVRTHDVTEQGLPEEPADVVISLLSWGFHYPIADYRPNVNPGGVIIADCRIGTPALAELSNRGECTVVHLSSKYARVVCQC